MKRLLLILLLIVTANVAVKAAGVDTVDVNGRQWVLNTPDNNGYGYSVTYSSDDTSVTGTGGYGLFGAMYTELDLCVGDSVSYDYYLTKEMRNLWQGGESDWIGDSWTGFLGEKDGGFDIPTFTYTNVTNKLYYTNDASTLYLLNAGISAASTTPITGIHFEWTFESDTTFSIDITDIATGQVIAQDWTGSISSVSDIKGFTAGIWDSEQDVTVANFNHTVVPEPATLLLLGLGVLSMRRKK